MGINAVIYSKTKTLRYFGLTQEQAEHIFLDDESLLTFDELKIRYDNPELGKLPQWLVAEGGYDKLTQIIQQGINIKYGVKYNYWISQQDLLQIMYEFVLERIHLYKSEQHIKSAVANRMVWLWRQHTARSSYFDGSLQDPISVNSPEGDDRERSDTIAQKTADIENIDFINHLRQIKNKQVKLLLIATGYMIADIEELKPDLEEILEQVDEKIKTNLLKLLDRINKRQEIIHKKQSKSQCSERIPSPVTFQDIVKATGFSQQEISMKKDDEEIKTVDKLGIKEAVLEAKKYILNMDIIKAKPLSKSKNKEELSAIY